MSFEQEEILQERFGALQVMGFVLTLSVMHSYTVPEPEPDRHVMAQGGAKAMLWMVLFLFKSLSVWLIGIGIKINLYNPVAAADEFFSHDQRLQVMTPPPPSPHPPSPLTTAHPSAPAPLTVSQAKTAPPHPPPSRGRLPPRHATTSPPHHLAPSPSHRLISPRLPCNPLSSRAAPTAPQLGAACAACYAVGNLMAALHHPKGPSAFYRELLSSRYSTVFFALWAANIAAMLLATWIKVVRCARAAPRTFTSGVPAEPGPAPPASHLTRASPPPPTRHRTISTPSRLAPPTAAPAPRSCLRTSTRRCRRCSASCTCCSATSSSCGYRRGRAAAAATASSRLLRGPC